MELSRGTESKRWTLTKLCIVFSLLLIAIFIRVGGDIRRSCSGQSMLPDDAYYYLVVAKNFVSSGTMSFDGLSTTNGYHPLLFWIEVLMYLLGTLHISEVNQIVAVICILQFIFVGTVCTVMWWIYRNWTAYSSQAIAVLVGLTLLLYPRNISLFVCGMESGLVFPFLVLFLFFVWRSRWIWAGLAAVLLVLSRLDTSVYIVFPVVLVASLRGAKSFWSFSKRCLQMGGPPAVAIVVLMIVYKIVFGYPMPISGVCKSSFPIPHIQWHLIMNSAVLALESRSPQILATINPFTASVVLAICVLLLYRHGFLSLLQRKTALFLVALGLLQLFSFLLFQKWAKPIPAWYFAPLVIFCCASVGAVITNLFNRRILLGSCLVIAFVFVVLSGIREYRLALNPSARYGVDLENFINTQPQDAVWAATDCGSISFWTGVRFVNLDGVINGFEYQNVLRKQRLSDYLREINVRYLVIGIWQHEQIHYFEPMYAHRVDSAVFDGDYETFDYYVYSYMYGNYSDKVTLHRNQEVWRGNLRLDGTSLARTVVFDLSGVNTAQQNNIHSVVIVE